MTRTIAKRCVPVCQRPDSDCPLTLLSLGDDKVPWRAYAIAAVIVSAVGLICAITYPEQALKTWAVAGLLLTILLLVDISSIGAENRQDDKVHRAVRGCRTQEIEVQTGEIDGVTLSASELKDVYETHRYIVAVAAYRPDGYYAYVIPKAFMDEASYKDLRRLFLTVLPEGHVRYMI